MSINSMSGKRRHPNNDATAHMLMEGITRVNRVFTCKGFRHFPDAEAVLDL